MMIERELIEKLSSLKSITPRKEWVILTRNKIMGQDKQSIDWVGQIGHLLSSTFMRPAFATACFMVLISAGLIFQISKQSLPGDTFYGLKTAFEGAQLTLTPKNDQTLLRVQIAQNRLDEIKAITGSKNKQKLSSAIKEFQEISARASSDFVRLVENEPKKALQASREIVQLQREQAQLEKTLGAQFGNHENSDLENATKTLIENEFADLDSRSLTENQIVLLNDAKSAFLNGDYQTALEKIWILSN